MEKILIIIGALTIIIYLPEIIAILAFMLITIVNKLVNLIEKIFKLK